MLARGLVESGQNNPRFMFKCLSNTVPTQDVPPAQLMMQNFLKLIIRGVAKVSGRRVSWEGLGERRCEEGQT